MAQQVSGVSVTLRLRFDAFELDEADARLTRDGQPVSLPPRAFGVLCALARTPGQLMTKNALLDAVWGHQHVSESVLKTTISELRAALADDAKNPRYIETASRFGYRFIGAVVAPRAETAPLPQARPVARISPELSMVGRRAALARLHEAWRKAQAGERQLLFVAGEAGVGKTTLIESFIHDLAPDVAMFGRCVEHFGTSEPYLPLLEALKELCRRHPDVAATMRSVAPTWLIQMPWLINEADRAALHRELAGTHQDRMVREMRELMDRYTQARPMLFVLEDLHWSDLGTLRMMEHFARRPREVRLMWVASFRLTQVIAENHPLRELRQELRLHRLCDEILLDPFSESEVGAYLQTRIPDTPFPEGFIRRLHQHTDGLPLFVANVTDTLVAQAAIDSTAKDKWLQGSTDVPLPVPDSLAGVIENQIGRLPAEAQALLEAASVCGMDFRAGVVAAMIGRDAEWVSERCDDLVRRQIWLRHVEIVELPDGELDSRYAFLHALYQHVFYQRVALSQRVQHHRRAARAIEERPLPAEAPASAELASHYERGHQPMLAIRHYADAAHTALGHFAPLDAENLTSQALRLLDRCKDGPERMEIEMLLNARRGVACTQLYGVGSSEAKLAFERVKVLCDALPEDPTRALLMNGLGLTLYIRGEYDEAAALATRVEGLYQRYGEPVLLVFACNLLGMIHAVQAKHELSRQVFERGLPACEQITDAVSLASFVVDPLVSMRTNLALPLLHMGYVDQAQAHVDTARVRAWRTGQPIARMLTLWVTGMIQIRRGEPERVAATGAALRTLVDESMLVHGGGPAHWLSGWAKAQMGEPREGYKLIRAGYAVHEKNGSYAGNTETLGYAAEALLLDGDIAGAERDLAEAVALSERINEPISMTNLLLLRGRIAEARKEQGGARASMLEALATARAQNSLFYEVKALVALCERGDASREDVGALRHAYERMTEGRDMPMMKRAAELLATSPNPRTTKRAS